CHMHGAGEIGRGGRRRNRIRHRRLCVGQTCPVQGRSSNGVRHGRGAGESIGCGGRSRMRNRIRHRRLRVGQTCPVQGRSRKGGRHGGGASEGIGRGGRWRV